MRSYCRDNKFGFRKRNEFYDIFNTHRINKNNTNSLFMLNI